MYMRGLIMCQSSALVLQYEPFIRSWAKQLCRKLGIIDRQRKHDVLQGCFLVAVRVVTTGEFDPSRGDLSHYLRQFCGPVAIKESGVMNDALDLPPRVRLQITRITEALARDPNIDTELLATTLKVPRSLVRQVKNGLQTGVALSLDTPVSSEDESLTLIDMLEQPDDERDVEIERRQRLRLIVSNGLEHLTARDRVVIEERYLGPESQKLKVIGEALQVSSERVRQIEVRAIEKLRSSLV